MYVSLWLYTRQNYPMDFLLFCMGGQLRHFRSKPSTNTVLKSKGVDPKPILVAKKVLFSAISNLISLFRPIAMMA